MKCPVCDLENSAMNCTQCGFDTSRDYPLHPTFGPVGRVPSVSAKKKQWLDSQKKPFSSSDGPRFVDYQEMVSDAATADEQYRQSRENQLLRSLQAANEEIAELKRNKREYEKRIESLKTELRTLTHYVYPENQTLQERVHILGQQNKDMEERIHILDQQNKDMEERIHILDQHNDALEERIHTLDERNNALIKESIQMEDNVCELVMKLGEAERLHQDALAHISRLEKENKVLTDDLKQSEDYRKASSRQYGNEVNKVRERDAKIAKLESQLETVQSRTAELEAERSKGLISRLFNR